jgi:hypothetical protein
MKKYEPPISNIETLLSEDPFCNGSTGERFQPSEDYDGEWIIED